MTDRTIAVLSAPRVFPRLPACLRRQAECLRHRAAPACFLAVWLCTLGICGHQRAGAAGPRRYISDAGWQATNPLLPKRIHLSRLWPDLSLMPHSPVIGPPGWRPVYSPANWKTFRKIFGAREDNIIRDTLSRRMNLAADMLAAAGAAKSRGYRRLLLLRVFALSFRYHVGIPLAHRALAQYLRNIDTRNLVQVAPVWTMANEMAFMRGSAAQNRRRAILAQAANTQLTMSLLNAGQVEDAARVVRHLVIHETVAVRADHPLMSAMGTVRALVGQTRSMMNFLAGKFQSAGINPESAMDVYLYTRFIRPIPRLRRWLENRWRTSSVGRLDRDLAECGSNVQAQFSAGHDLAVAADPLPMGILRDRVFYAALVHFRAFMASKKTRWDRIHRTLAKIAIQHVIEQGARPNPVVAPLDILIHRPANQHPD